MKHLIIVAHPSEDSFTMGLTRAYEAELEKLEHSRRTYDLYRMGFDPVLAAHELAPANADHPADAEQHVGRVRSCVRQHFPAD